MARGTDGQRAHDILLSFEPLSRYGACWYYVWQAYAQAGAQTNMGSSATAYEGWNLSQGKHPGDFNPPPGAAIWLGRRYDGNMDGDVFIAGQYDGDHAATDQPIYGQTGTTTIRDRMNLCGREYLGWTDHVLDCPIDMGGQPEPEPEPVPTPVEEDDEMPKNSGFIYTRESDQQLICGICNLGSGAFFEWWDGGGAYNSAVALAFDAPTFAAITESHRDVINAACAQVREQEAEPGRAHPAAPGRTRGTNGP